MKDAYILGIDVGTTGTKTLLFSSGGEILAHAYRGYPLSAPQIGYSEQNAEDWWQAVCETVREVCADGDCGQNVAAISLSTQGGTMVPVAADGKPLRPAIVWSDTRCRREHDAYLRECGAAQSVYEKTGWELLYCYLLLTIRYLRTQEPEIYAQTAKFLSVPDYISLKMTGTAAIDLSNAGINQLTDIRRAVYDEDLRRFAGVREEQLPKIVRSGDVIGHLSEAAAKELGLSADCLLVAGAHDQYAVALGAGALQAGDILIGSGTCWVVTAMNSEPDFASGLAQSVAAVPGMWGSLWSLSTGGVCLDWLRKNVACAEDRAVIDYETINREAEKRKAAEDGLFFVPFSGLYGMGKTTGKATFAGLDLSHDRFHMARAVMEGVVFQIVWMLEKFRTKPSENGIILAGGASKSRFWSQLLADISGLPVRIPAVADLACVGAAIMAGTGCGLFAGMEEGYRKMAVREQVIYPDKQRTAIYKPLLETYKNQTAALATVYEQKNLLEEHI